MPLKSGDRVGSYVIGDRIGAGGMGEVYRAADSRLKREVAIKALPESLVGDPDRAARLEREAHLLASLNHPNIASIHGLEVSQGMQCLILELIEGDTLAERLERGPVPVEDVVRVGQQIAGALEAAHERGIIHRDLKPVNIKVTPDGTVKVLDFGLAKVFETEGGEQSAELSLSPTMTAAATRVGVILGTAAYMSPEQARGRTVDKRADIWAFGVILFELLGGRHLFGGETVSDTLASVLKSEPEWDRLPADTPAALRSLVRRCLERDPRRRLRDIGEARIILEDIAAGRVVDDAAQVAASTEPRRGMSPAVIGATLILATALAGAAAWLLKPAPPTQLRKFEILVEGLDRRSVAISPDGGTIAYTTRDGLWLRRLDKLEAQLIPATDGAALPFWAPDGTEVAYAMNNRLWKIAIKGGEGTLVSELPGSLVNGAGGSWGDDGQIAFAYGGGPIFAVPERGGDFKVIIEPDGAQEDDHFHEPHWLPDGAGLLFTIHRSGNKGTDTLALFHEGQRKNLLQLPGQTIWRPVYSPTGHILYRRQPNNGGLWALPFSLTTLETAGEPFIVAPESNTPSVSVDGTLVYVPGAGGGLEQLVWLDRQGEVQELVGQPQEGMVYVSLSPDGGRVAVTGHENENYDIWVHDVTRKTKTRLTFGDGAEYNPAWSPSGDRIVYGADNGLAIRAADGTGEPQMLAENGRNASFSSDGATVIFEKPAVNGSADIWFRSANGEGEETLFLQTKADEWGPRISPDGRYVAYVSDESGREEIYLKRFPSGDGKWQASVNGGVWPVWSRDGGELIYRLNYRMKAVSVKTEPALTLGTPQELFSANDSRLRVRPRRYDVVPGGQRLIGVQSLEEDADQAGIKVILNWFAEFEAAP
jgi:Tol biopolymer transport system component